MLPLNAANVLTLVRISLIPVLAALLLSTLAESDLLAAIVFVIASATDALDGWLARRRSEVTQFGKLMDPLADKLLITSALVSLVALYRLDAWVAMVLALIWVDRPAAWVDILVYVTVAVTVLSGAEYFYRLRGLLAEDRSAPPQIATPSSHSRIET